jgi:hypothetical protein
MEEKFFCFDAKKVFENEMKRKRSETFKAEKEKGKFWDNL